MLDELREEEIVKKVGGRFRLSTLIQKRLVALNAGSRPLVDTNENEDQLHVVIREIMLDKIYLDSDANLRVADGEYGQGGPPELDFLKL
ncbi:MAG: DNA-directed RNA polymerase subunit omega [Pirellulales bacterium]|nr:DNA-directed RNA polymerase subunit omega [Pirellulales bacterium]